MDFRDQPTQPEPGDSEARSADLDAFYLELVEVQIDCDELLTALEQSDPTGVEIAACDLAATWVLITDMSQLIDAHGTETPAQKCHVRLACRAGHHVLAHLFRHAFAETARWKTDVSRLHGILGRVAARLRLKSPHDD